ncbi:YbfB/YjiJ family MFS transporter [Bacillus piscicola]|uniref:YbfB/YjiJ family MFS transporter n=1 Tax=Bacillus piscicola TaxID=1632684 RepID=UPI001F090B93|nr:YbfB/YjiJ family MFS transporter [Bacillus piscicola]
MSITASSKKEMLSVLVAGITVLLIVMGINRFAYTPILPLMVDHTSLSNEAAGYLASSNYFGYLAGALLGGVFAWKKGEAFYVYLHLAVNIASTFLMGLTEQEWLWHILRFTGGYTSGIVFVLISSIVMNALVRAGYSRWTGLFFGGVGLGIMSTGILVPITFPLFGWDGVWICLGIFSLLLVGLIRKRLPADPRPTQPANKQSSSKGHKSKLSFRKSSLPWLSLAYGLEGIGYVISGTYLVAFAADIPLLASYPSLTWVMVGAAAAPSCALWSKISAHIGTLPSLQAAFALQIVGVLVPVVFFNAVGALIGALLFGATFMGIVNLTMAEAREIAPDSSSGIIGGLTFLYGIGQVLGPAAAAFFISVTSALTASFYFAGVVLIIGIFALGIAHSIEKKTTRLGDFSHKKTIESSN